MNKSKASNIDFIGDIHGHADKLQELLTKLGYSYINGVYSHYERKVLFVGDYIDRGPQILATLEIVKAMVESGNAIALLGNHEYNALCFHIKKGDGGHLRPHLIKNLIQHKETIKQYQNKQELYDSYIEWYKTLPLFYEAETFRAVHACWDSNQIDLLRSKLIDNRLNNELIQESVKRGPDFYYAIDDILKGKEINLPEGKTFLDKDGTIRKKIRIKWWLNPAIATYKAISVLPLEDLKDEPIELGLLKNLDFYTASQKPIFFGHYWLDGEPTLYRTNICCLDYSVAKKGKLVAYRFDGEQELRNEKLVYV